MEQRQRNKIIIRTGRPQWPDGTSAPVHDVFENQKVMAANELKKASEAKSAPALAIVALAVAQYATLGTGRSLPLVASAKTRASFSKLDGLVAETARLLSKDIEVASAKIAGTQPQYAKLATAIGMSWI